MSVLVLSVLEGCLCCIMCDVEYQNVGMEFGLWKSMGWKSFGVNWWLFLIFEAFDSFFYPLHITWHEGEITYILLVPPSIFTVQRSILLGNAELTPTTSYLHGYISWNYVSYYDIVINFYYSSVKFLLDFTILVPFLHLFFLLWSWHYYLSLIFKWIC